MIKFWTTPILLIKVGLVQMVLVQLWLVQMGVVQMWTLTFTFWKASKVLIEFQYFNNNFLSQFNFPKLLKPFFLFGTELTK